MKWIVLSLLVWASAAGAEPYDRALFYEDWPVSEGCMTLRHQLLRDTAVYVTASENGCWVDRGKWIDPYSGDAIYDPRELQIDHLVPLAWAWRHGAENWTDEQRYEFATDPRFLIPVRGTLNQGKGADGPLDWLPPDENYHCAYVTRFMRGVLTWKLELSVNEAIEMSLLRAEVCADKRPAS